MANPLDTATINVNGKTYILRAQNSAGRGMLARRSLYGKTDREMYETALYERKLARSMNRQPSVTIEEA